MDNAPAVGILNRDILTRYKERKGVVTRRGTLDLLGSCRGWQFVLCIIDQFQRRGFDMYGIIDAINGETIYDDGPMKEKYDTLVGQMSEMVNNISKDIHPELYNYVSRNDSSIVEEYNPEEMELSLGNNYMCVYVNNLNEFGNRIGNVLHFFTIVKQENDQFEYNYYLNSAYGSNWVRAPQYTTPLDTDEFIQFFKAFNNDEPDAEYIRKFYVKYFLKTNMGKAYDEEDYEHNKKRRFLTISPDEGNENEIAGVITSLERGNKISCGIVRNYDEMMGEFINYWMSAMDGGKKTIKRSVKKRHLMKTTKRRRSSRSSKRYSR
jgi:hypothetical protein